MNDIFDKNNNITSEGEKLLINVTADNVIRLLPPLIISHSEATLVAEHLIKIIDKFLDA